MLKRFLITSAILCGLMSSAPAQETSIWGNVRGWTIGIDATIGNSCFIYAQFEGGLHFQLGFNMTNDTAYAVFGNSDWQSIEVDRTYPITMQMGRKAKWNGNATGGVMDGVPVLVVSSDNEDFVLEIASQTTLKAWFGTSQIANISLSGTMAAIREMVDCQNAMNKVPSKGADPFAGNSADPFAD